jgi:hypothetical protein
MPDAKAPGGVTIETLAQVATTLYVNDPNVQVGNHSEGIADKAVDAALIILNKCYAKLHPQKVDEPPPAAHNPAESSPEEHAGHPARKHPAKHK